MPGCSARTPGSSAPRSTAAPASTRPAGRRAATRQTRCSNGSPASPSAGRAWSPSSSRLSPAGEEFRGPGVLEGELATARRGDGGFGYDPIFIPAGETAPSPRSATAGSEATPIAPAPPRRSWRRSGRSPNPDGRGGGGRAGGPAVCSADGCGTGARRPHRDLLGSGQRRDRRRQRIAAGDDRRRPAARRAARGGNRAACSRRPNGSPGHAASASSPSSKPRRSREASSRCGPTAV